MVCGAVLGVAVTLAGMRGCVEAVLSALQMCAVLLTLEGRPSLGLEGALGSQPPCRHLDGLPTYTSTFSLRFKGVVKKAVCN